MAKYMHLLDGKPAALCTTGAGVYMAFVHNRMKAGNLLRDSLRQIRNEQKLALADSNPQDKSRFDYLCIAE